MPERPAVISVVLYSPEFRFARYIVTDGRHVAGGIDFRIPAAAGSQSHRHGQIAYPDGAPCTWHQPAAFSTWIFRGVQTRVFLRPTRSQTKPLSPCPTDHVRSCEVVLGRT